MKKVLILLVALLAVPVVAAPSDVAITCADDDVNTITVSYDATGDPNLIRGFGLDLTVDKGIITGVTILDPNYRIYPDQIVIVDGNVTDYNTPYAPGSLDSNVVTVELASLYTWDGNYNDPIGDPNNDYGYGMQPGTSGDLLSFTVSSDCNYTVTGNAARGDVVMEDPPDPNVTFCGGYISGDCFPSGHADYAEWVTMGKPPSWCYLRQCRGDAENATEAVGGKGQFWVGFDDLGVMVDNWMDKAGVTEASLAADFSHSSEAVGGKGQFRVGFDDLEILVDNWMDKLGSPPDCLDVP